MNKEIISTIGIFQKELEKTNIEDFYIDEFRRERLLIIGSFDFSYYHDVEIIFSNVYYICCSTYISADTFRLATTEEIKYMQQTIKGFVSDGYVFCLEDSFTEVKHFIVADNFEYHFEKICYFNGSERIEGEKLSEWAKIIINK